MEYLLDIPKSLIGKEIEMAVLFIVNSTYQMITAVQLRMTVYKNDSADIIITDNLAQNNRLKKSAEKSGIFRNIFTMITKDYDWKNWKFTLGAFLCDRVIQEKLPDILKLHYEVFLYCNFAGVSVCVGAYLKRKQNVELVMFEDGFASYSDFWKDGLERAVCPKSITDKLLYGWMRRTPYYTSKYYVFNPELIKDWSFDFQIKEIEKIGDKTRDILNLVFEYNDCEDDYSGVKCIFFEESYYADGVFVGDVEVVNRVAEIVGKESIMIKIHPRNPENRFSKLGYRTNENTIIPWEIIALNNDFSDTVLMTIASGSSITSYYVSEQKAKKSILLYDMAEIDKSKLTPSIVVFDKICRRNSYFVYPKNYADLEEEMKK